MYTALLDIVISKNEYMSIYIQLCKSYTLCVTIIIVTVT